MLALKVLGLVALLFVLTLNGAAGLSDQKSRDSFLIDNVTLFDGEEIVDNISVLVEGGKIARIQAKIEEDHVTIDGTGKFLMPAMTNSHVHAWDERQLREAARAGVLNLLDMLSFDLYGLKRLNDLPGYARFYTSGYAATVKGGHGTQFSPDYAPAPTIDSVGDIEPFVRDRIAGGADYIKIIVEPFRNTLPHEWVQAIIDTAHENDRRAVVHVSWYDDARTVIENGADGLMHIWNDKAPAHELKTLRANHDFFVVPTLSVWITSRWQIEKHGRQKYAKRHFTEELKKIYDAGVPILAGTDPPNNGINHGTDLHKELLYFSEAGMPNIDVLKTATSNPAKAFEVLRDTGQIKVGLNADMILLDKSPIDDMENIGSIDTVWKMGIEVKLR